MAKLLLVYPVKAGHNRAKQIVTVVKKSKKIIQKFTVKQTDNNRDKKGYKYQLTAIDLQ